MAQETKDQSVAESSSWSGSQTAIPCWFMRGGTSRGPFFRDQDLPEDRSDRDAILLAALGSPDPRQIDGLGGAHPLTSKTGIVGTSRLDGVDLEFQFAQLQPDSDQVDITANCGNMLAAVVPFAIESGLLLPTGDVTTARVLTLNTGMIAEITVETMANDQGGYVQYGGATAIDGVPGMSSPVLISFLDTAGSICSSLLPTHSVRDTVNVNGIGAVEVTCIDNGQPLVIVKASDMFRTGNESAATLNADTELKERLEQLRLACGELMGLGDVSAKNYPKMTLVSPATRGGSINTRSFIPHFCHESIGVLAAVTVATACVLEGSVAHDLVALAQDVDVTVSVEHPSGEFTVHLGLDPDKPQHINRSALLRTARLIMSGNVFVPRNLTHSESSRLLEEQA